VTDSQAEAARTAGELARRAAAVQETVAAWRAAGPHSTVADRPEPRAAGELSAAALFAAAADGWGTGQPEGSQPVMRVPLGGGRRRFGWRRAEEPAVWFVAGTLPAQPPAQVILVRPNETVVALSRRAPAETIAAAVRQLREPVRKWTRPGDGFKFPRQWGGHPFATRSDYVRPRPTWELTASGLRPAPAEDPPLVDTSTAAVFTSPAPGIGGDVARQWLSFLNARADPPAPINLTDIWAWAAVDALIDELGLAIAHLGKADREAAQQRVAAAGWGRPREAVLGLVRQRLTDRHAVLADDPGRTLWRQLGIRAVRQREEQDILHLHWGRDGWRQVDLVPVWTPSGEPAARALIYFGKTVIDVNVAADPAEIDAQVWPSLAEAHRGSFAAVPLGPADGLTGRLAGLGERLERAAAFADWLATTTHD
jgi:hypothetical protein